MFHQNLILNVFFFFCCNFEKILFVCWFIPYSVLHILYLMYNLDTSESIWERSLIFGRLNGAWAEE